MTELEKQAMWMSLAGSKPMPKPVNSFFIRRIRRRGYVGKHLGGELRALRMKRGWNGAQVAGLLNTTRQTVSNIELGRTSIRESIVDVYHQLPDMNHGG